ncbi:MAG: hypothetical protein R2758_17135 [Bacteroidales bacterium]
MQKDGCAGEDSAVPAAFFLVSGHAFSVTSRVEKGVVDLRHIEQGDDFTVRLNGEWEFWFGTFIYGTPGVIATP